LFGNYLALGVWPIIMASRLWFQMTLNPRRRGSDPEMILTWMTMIFTLCWPPGFPRAVVIKGPEQSDLGAAAELHHDRKEGWEGNYRQSEGDVCLKKVEWKT